MPRKPLKICYPDCKHLSITEEEQKLATHVEIHYCHKYNKQVFHRNVHPNLIRVQGCDYNISKEKAIPLDEFEAPAVQKSKCEECRFNKSRGCILKLKLPCNGFARKRMLPPKVL